jgi:hypothetical protein
VGEKAPVSFLLQLRKLVLEVCYRRTSVMVVRGEEVGVAGVQEPLGTMPAGF